MSHKIYPTRKEAEAVADKDFDRVDPAGEAWIVRPILLNTDEVAKLVGKCKRTVFRMIEDGRLPEMVDPKGPDNRWLLKDIMKYID